MICDRCGEASETLHEFVAGFPVCETDRYCTSCLEYLEDEAERLLDVPEDGVYDEDFPL